MIIEYKPKSLADQVYERLEDSILSGEYAPGEILSEKRLSTELGVSRTPIREALTRLEYDNLVKETTSGTEVRGISDSDVDDMFEIKKRLEVIAAKRAAKNMSEEKLAALKDVVEQQEYYAKKGDAIKVRNLDTQFHDIIYAGCGSLMFKTILTGVHHKLMKYRTKSLENEGRIIASVSEHVAIYNAIKDSNTKEIEKLVLAHIDNVYKNVKAAQNAKAE